MTKFAFLVHPLNEVTKVLMRLDTNGALRNHWGTDLAGFCNDAHQTFAAHAVAALQSPDSVHMVDELLDLTSVTGARTHGRVYEIPMNPHEIIDDPSRAVMFMEQAVVQAAEWGAGLVGLGSMTGIVGNRGAHLAQQASIPVTTGNCLTVYATLQNLFQICRDTGLRLEEEVVAVVGAPGSIASALVRLLAGKCEKLLAVARRESSRASKLAKETGAELLFDLPEALAQARLVLTATSSGNCIDSGSLASGTVVLDVAVPADVYHAAKPREDVLVVNAGLAKTPKTMQRTSMFLGFYQGVVPCCLGETMVLSLEQRAECYSIGRDLDLASVKEIGTLAKQHGFDFSILMSHGLPLDESRLARFRKTVTRCRWEKQSAAVSHNGRCASPASSLISISEASQAQRLFSRYLNPVLAALTGKDSLIKTFVRGEGCHLYDAEGKSFLDFVSGFGALNLGHNHPSVASAVSSALEHKAPGFTQVAVNPTTALLAEALVSLTPDGLEMVVFTNSGAEAVDEALKLARAATGRTGLLSCEGGYHGKTLGALSVSPNKTYQRTFAPLLQGCATVPFGDLETLEHLLRTRQYAAFLVEPIQGEGGMRVPPEGYLTEAQRLCRNTGTLLIVDEAQTGLGRTGKLLAVEHERVEPDVLVLAKSLGGGLMPIGAALTRRDLWRKALGTLDTSSLYSSTCSGGSLASAAGLAVVQALSDEGLLDNVRQRGEQLQDGLRELCEHVSVLKEVHGRGLMLGLEFQPLSAALVQHFKGMDSSGMLPLLAPNLDDWLATVSALYVMHNLINVHGIFVQTTRCNPLVLRIQPPLLITEQQVDRFLEAIEEACSEWNFISGIVEIVLSRSVGEHSRNVSSQPSLIKSP